MALISPTEVARQYGVPARMLRQWRQQSIGPEYFQFTARTVSYHDDYVRDWFNDPRNADLLAGSSSSSVEMCRDGRVRRHGPQVGR